MKPRDPETESEKIETPPREDRPGKDFPPVIEGELVDETEIETRIRVSPPTGRQNLAGESDKRVQKNAVASDKRQKSGAVGEPPNDRSAVRTYLLLPVIFLTVTLLGGLRLSEPANAFVFLKPALVCLVFAAILLLLFFRAGLVRVGGWFSDKFSTLKNLANALVLFTLFAASVQIFNALLPERGLPFWIVGLLFFWTLWNNLFGSFTARRLVQSLGGLFGLAFVLKYLVLANLTAPADADGGWLRALIENPGKEFFTYLLDLPRYAAGTGYIQFFTVIFYLVGLFLLAPELTEGKTDQRGDAAEMRRD